MARGKTQKQKSQPYPNGQTFPVRTPVSAEPDKPVDDEGSVKTIVVHAQPVGSSGIQSYYGYVQEEYLQTLQGHARADIFDKMRRSDPQIKMALTAVKNPIKSATWALEPGDDSADAKADAELVDQILFNDMERPFPVFLHEALSCIDFGHSVFETIHKVVKNHPKFGSYIGVRQFAHRSPRTIHRFNIDADSGKLVSVTQYAYGDLQRLVDIPAEFLVVFTLDQEGDNYEGIAALRACYGPWLRKNMYLKLQAIGIEKYAVPTPVAEVPEGKQNSQEYANLVQALQIWTSHQQNYVTLPAGWKVEFKNNPFDAEKIQRAIDSEDKAIINAFVANFLDLGTSAGGHGSFALGEDKSQFFLGGIEYIANHVADVLNRGVIQDLIKLNRGPRKVYPKLKCSGITDKGGLELAQALKFLTEAQVVIPDDKLEDNMRARYAMPKRSTEGQRQVNSPGSPTADDVAKDGVPAAPAAGAAKKKGQKLSESREFELAQTPRGHIADCKAELKDLMQKALRDTGEGLVEDIVSRLKRATPSQRRGVIKQVDASGKNKYKAALKDALGTIADEALAQARREVPKAKNVKLAEFEDLPKAIQDKLLAQADLLSESQFADLEKAVFFQFDSAIDSTDSMDQLVKDLYDAIDKYIESASVDAAAGNVTATAVNYVRNAFFMDDEVAEQIASFTFTNPAPVSAICQELAGQTFDIDDPAVQRYQPPLHHNCKTYLIPNLKDGPRADQETIEHFSPSEAALKSITLTESRAVPPAAGPEDFEKIVLSETEDEYRYSRNGKVTRRTIVKYADASKEEVISVKGVPAEGAI